MGAGSATTLSPASLRTTPPLVREMLEAALAEPIALSPDERYLCGHYLAYLLGGARRRGPLLRRKLDPRNADRARLLLGLTALMIADAGASGASASYSDSIADPSAVTESFPATDAAVARAAELLEMRYEVRPLLSPMVVMKYLACRDTPARRKRLRELRKRILRASPYARRHMTDGNGALNPGLIPQSLDDLRQIAPDRTEMDDQLVARWNRLGEVWRGDAGFREAVLRYATSSAAGHPAGAELWPEVVYPLIARARWQRRNRPRAERVRDALLGGLLHVPSAGLRFDRAFRASVPEPVVAKLDVSLDALVDSQELEVDLRVAGPPPAPGNGREPDSALRRAGAAISLHDLSAHLSHEHLTDAPSKVKGMVPLVSPDPVRFLQGELRDLWQEAAAALQTPGTKKSHRNVPVGPYRLAVIPSVRGRSAGQVAIQGMPNKQIELTTPPFRSKGSASRPVVAAWSYRDNSLALVHLDFRGVERYVLWHATSGRQTNYGNVAELHHDLYHLGLEIPDQLDCVLSKRFRPRDAG